MLFLSPRTNAPDGYAVTGWAQGKFSIRKDAANGEVVAADGGRPATGPLPLARFRARIVERVKSSPAHP